MDQQERMKIGMMVVGLGIVLVLLAVAYLVGRQQKECEVSDCSDSKNEVKRLSVKIKALENDLEIARSNTSAELNECLTKIQLVVDNFPGVASSLGFV